MVLEALKISEKFFQNIASEDGLGSDCAKEFDGSTLECREANTIMGDIDLKDYKPIYSTYFFKDECAD